jgi:tRNA pseudouridine synthase 10
MDVLQSALKMLEKYPLCDHCLGRQFALLGHGLENDERGRAIKLVLTMRAHMQSLSKGKEGLQALKILATNGSSDTAKQILEMEKRSLTQDNPKACFLCEDEFNACDTMVHGALRQLGEYEFSNFLVGTELPAKIAEREDEFKAEFEVTYGENLRNEFGRVVGKKIADHCGKVVEFKKP